MTLIISLGNTCNVRQQINEYHKNTETHFFDWLYTNFITIIQILDEIIIPTNLLDIENFGKLKDIKNIDDANKECYTIAHKYINLYAAHDIPITIDFDSGLISFVEKYKRRLKRFKSVLLDDNIIDFIHMVDSHHTIPYMPSVDDIKTFFLLIKKINPNKKCNLHILLKPELKKYNLVATTNYNDIPNIYVYDLLHVNSKKEPFYMEYHLNWNIVFDNIKKIYIRNLYF